MTTPARELPPINIPVRNRRADILAIVGLVAVVVVAHGWSLGDGLFFDDYWHRAQLRELGWGFDDLVESATFDLPGRLAHMWWQDQPLQWRYARPVAMLFMKIELLISGGSPVGVHLCALVWHALSGALVYLLAIWALRHRGWAFFAGVLFVIWPHSVFGVSWIAARNALVSGCFFFGAMYAYVIASSRRHERGGALGVAALIVSLICWGLALFSRETAIIFPLLVVVVDFAIGGRVLIVRRLPVYALMALLGGAYLYWRLMVFPTSSPPDIYYTSPSGVGYAVWAASKLLNMLFAMFFQTPMFLGLVTYDSGSATELIATAIMVVLVAVMAWWYLAASRGLKSRWLWPTWLVAAFVPVIPVFVMPHFAYLPAAALAIILTVIVRSLRRWGRPAFATFLVAITLWSVGVYRFAWRGIVRSEQLVYADIEAETPTPESSAKLFFINLPVAGIYASVAMREAWNVDDLEGYVLTFARHPLMMDRPSTIERVGDRELIISTAEPGWFSGMSGRMLLDGMRPGEPLRSGEMLVGEEFDTTIVAADEHGVTKLRFTFPKPLESSEYLFYMSTPEQPAIRVRFAGSAIEFVTAPQSKRRDEMIRARSHYFQIIDFMSRVVKSDMFLTGDSDD